MRTQSVIHLQMLARWRNLNTHSCSKFNAKMLLRQRQAKIYFQNSDKVIVEVFNMYTKFIQIRNNNRVSIAAQALFIEIIKFSKE